MLVSCHWDVGRDDDIVYAVASAEMQPAHLARHRLGHPRGPCGQNRDGRLGKGMKVTERRPTLVALAASLRKLVHDASLLRGGGRCEATVKYRKCCETRVEKDNEAEPFFLCLPSMKVTSVHGTFFTGLYRTPKGGPRV